MSWKVFECNSAPTECSFRLLDVGMPGVVDLFHVDLGNELQVAFMMLLSLEIQLILLGVGLGIQVLHLAPRAAGGGQVDLIRHLISEAFKKDRLVLLEVEVPTCLIAENLNVHAH